MQEVLNTLLQTIITVAIPLVAAFVIRLLNACAKHTKTIATNEAAERYIKEASDAVTIAIAHVSQTFVDDLKKSNIFTSDKQREALIQALDVARSMLTAEASYYITKTYGSLQTFLASKIEAGVFLQK